MSWRTARFLPEFRIELDVDLGHAVLRECHEELGQLSWIPSVAPIASRRARMLGFPGVDSQPGRLNATPFVRISVAGSRSLLTHAMSIMSRMPGMSAGSFTIGQFQISA
ncbi:MAG: hypothetical protein R2848_06445 [Thermomicrobiales bacterium]